MRVVVKVESTHRPDGPPWPAAFFDRLHAGHHAVALDFATARGDGWSFDLVTAADVVIEGSRPRALAQLGIDRGAGPDRAACRLSITAYGRAGGARHGRLRRRRRRCRRPVALRPAGPCSWPTWWPTR